MPLVEQASNLNYRAPTNWDWDDKLPSQTFNGSMSYVTGSHNAKVGFEMQRGHFMRGDNNDTTGGLWYTVAAGVPQFVTIQSPLSGWQNNLNYNLGIFAQDQWTLNRLTLNGGVRLDLLNESTEAFTATPHRWLPNRNDSFAAVENVPELEGRQPAHCGGLRSVRHRQDSAQGQRQPRRRAGLDPLRADEQSRRSRSSRQTARVWTDNGNFVPDCDLANGPDQDNRRVRRRSLRRMADARASAAPFREPATTPRSWTGGVCGHGTGSSPSAFSTRSCRGFRRRSGTSAASRATST